METVSGVTNSTRSELLCTFCCPFSTPALVLPSPNSPFQNQPVQPVKAGLLNGAGVHLGLGYLHCQWLVFLFGDSEYLRIPSLGWEAKAAPPTQCPLTLAMCKSQGTTVHQIMSPVHIHLEPQNVTLTENRILRYLKSNDWYPHKQRHRHRQEGQVKTVSGWQRLK